MRMRSVSEDCATSESEDEEGGELKVSEKSGSPRVETIVIGGMGNSIKSDSESLVNRAVCESDGKEIVSATLEVRPPQGVEGKVVASGPTVVRPPKGGIP